MKEDAEYTWIGHMHNLIRLRELALSDPVGPHVGNAIKCQALIGRALEMQQASVKVDAPENPFLDD